MTTYMEKEQIDKLGCGFFRVLDKLSKQGLIDPEKDKCDKPEEWELSKRLEKIQKEMENPIRILQDGEDEEC